jgi:hypothetical protein
VPALVLFCFAASAEEADAPEKDLAQEVESLRSELEMLKAATASSFDAVPEDDFSAPNLKMNGMGHVQYQVGLDRTGDSNNNFVLGGVDLFLTSQVSESLSFFNETVFEYGEGGENILDVERVLVMWQATPWLKLSAGRGHTTLGYWNQRFHHGVWLQTTVDRPRVYDFEDDGGVLPVHFVGVRADGAFNLPGVRLSYSASVANGRGDIVDSIQLIEDLTDGKQLTAMIELEPEFLPGLGVGFNALTDQIPAVEGVAGREDEIPEHIFGAHAWYVQGPFEVITEGSVILHEVQGETLLHAGGYGQLAVRVLNARPYYRFDFILADENEDPFFNTAEEVPETSMINAFGVRWDWSIFSALKLEFRRTDAAGGADHEVVGQVSMAF